MKKETKKALESKIRNPHIQLNEKVMDNIKDLTVDDEVIITATLKVTDIRRETDYDMPCNYEEEKRTEGPKILVAGFEVKDIKKVK